MLPLLLGADLGGNGLLKPWEKVVLRLWVNLGCPPQHSHLMPTMPWDGPDVGCARVASRGNCVVFTGQAPRAFSCRILVTISNAHVSVMSNRQLLFCQTRGGGGGMHM